MPEDKKELNAMYIYDKLEANEQRYLQLAEKLEEFTISTQVAITRIETKVPLYVAGSTVMFSIITTILMKVVFK